MKKVSTRKSIVVVFVVTVIVIVVYGIKTRHNVIEPDQSRLDDRYYRQQSVFALGLDATQCRQYLNDPGWLEWHDDLLFRLALVETDRQRARQCMHKIIEMYPHAISEHEIKYFGTPNRQRSQEVLAYIRKYPTMTIDQAYLWLAYDAMSATPLQPAVVRDWLEKTLSNDAGNPRYDDGEFNANVVATERIDRPYVTAAEMLMELNHRHWPDQYRATLERFIADGNLSTIRTIALIKIAQEEYQQRNIAAAKKYARMLIERYPRSEYVEDAKSFLTIGQENN